MPSFWFEDTGVDIILHNKYGVYSKVELETQLREGHLTVEELGEIYSLAPFQIVRVLRLLKITHRNILSDIRIPDFSITTSMHQIILGTMLGDAFMSDKRSYKLSHSINQMDYLYHTAEGLGPAVSTISYVSNDLGKSLHLWTNRHAIFEPYHQRFYPEKKGKKILHEGSVYDLEAEGLAYWYMDDGKYHDYGFYLCTAGFLSSELEILVTLLQNKFSIKASQQFHNKEKDHRYIYVHAESKSQFLSLIEPYIIPSMKYKLNGSPYPKLQDELLIASRHLNFCNKVDRGVRFSGNTALEEIINKDKLDSKKGAFFERIRTQIKEKKQISFTKMREEPSEEELRSLLEQGLTDDKIAKRYGFGRNRIASLRRALNIPREKVRKRIDKSKFPCMDVKLVGINKIESNEYIPNTPEMGLLIHSISEDGLTQPIVVFYDLDRDKYVVIDGFCRYIVLRDHFKYEKIPVVVLNKPLNDRMASTIRHNIRASVATTR
jgi:hypothetical protein